MRPYLKNKVKAKRAAGVSQEVEPSKHKALVQTSKQETSKLFDV
jgi:hypothetical protein